MKGRRVLVGVAIAFMSAFCGFWSVAHAIEIDLCGPTMTAEGYFRQEFAFNVAGTSEEKTNQSGLQSAYQIWYLDTNTTFSNNLELRTILRLWGDMAYTILDDNSHFERYFEDSKSNQEWQDDWNEILREFYVTYYTQKFLFRAGKQQIGWGEADGLRLMDVINPLDARHDFLFYDTEGYEEARIPKWMIKTEFYPGDFGPFYDNGIELYWNPGDVQEFGDLLPGYINAPLAAGVFAPAGLTNVYPNDIQGSWGTWGAPTPFAPLPVTLDKKEKATSLTNGEFGTRIKLNFSDTFMTLNGWYGWKHQDVLDYQGLIPDARALAQGYPGSLLFNREWTRLKVLGFTLSREMFGVGDLAGQNANPVLRVEALYSFDEKFNSRGQSADPVTGLPTELFHIVDQDQLRYMIGFDWSMNIKFINPTKSTFVSGQFFHIWTPNVPDGADKALLQLAPYSGWRWPEHQFYYTLLLRTEYKNEQIVPSMLYVQDCHTGAAWVKTKLYFRIGNHWRPEIGYLWIGRNRDHGTVNAGPTTGGPVWATNDWESFGLFEDRDQVWVRIQYQF